ncbi:MAG: hypothetical protein R3B38_02170 [Patescibacteria group bacterium]
MPHQIVIALTLAFLIGVISGSIFYPLLLVVVVGILLTTILKKSDLFYLGFASLLFFIIGNYTYGSYSTNYINHIPRQLFDESIVIQGTVLNVIDLGSTRPQSVIVKTDNQETNFTTQLETWDRKNFLPGDTIEAIAHVDQLDEVDYWLAQNHIHVYGTITNLSNVSNPLS